MAGIAKVLIVEDDMLIQRMYEKIFTFEKFDVVVASDGVEGLEAVKKHKPDIVLLDVMMPNMNGMEVLEKLKADSELKDIPVIMLSNLAGDSDIHTALSKGALKYLIKSEYDPKEIANIVKEMLGK